MIGDLTTWLLEQIAEDERRARLHPVEPPFGLWSANRILSECATKRLRIELHTSQEPHAHECPGDHSEFGAEFGDAGCPTLRLEALPYVGRPGYLEEWRP